MSRNFISTILLSIVTIPAIAANNSYPLTPITFEKVQLQDAFWLPRLQTQAEVTVPFSLEKTEPAIENLRRCGNFLKGRGGELPFTHRFISSDLYKVMEGAAYILQTRRDPELEQQLDEIIDIIGEAQQEDGYLYVSHICKIPNPGEMGKTPYSFVVHSHELYNMGHMYEGAIAYYRATGKEKWLKIAEKNAQHINRVFFEGDPNYNNGKPVMQAPGHQELELALCKLYVVTGKSLYLEMARKFLDIRGVTYRPSGSGTMSPEYAQQHKPVREQERAVGHAVRAVYLYTGMADVAVLSGDLSYTNALQKIWHNIVDTKMHITGGLGAVHGIEGFGPEYELPNLKTYDETCAAVANVFFNYRMFLLYQDAGYFDVAEVSLFNNSLAGVNLAGNKFFYVNPLETDGKRKFNHGRSGRSPWFDCACCPSNIARLMPQVSGYMYAHTDNDIYLTLYAASTTDIPLADGTVKIRQQTEYPFDGKIALTLTPQKTQTFKLHLRIPTWAGADRFVPGDLYHYIDGQKPKWTLSVNGQTVTTTVTKGFAVIERAWKAGDRVQLDLPMPVRYNGCTEQVEANRNRLAVTRGPLVYCAEEIDNGPSPVQEFYLDKISRQTTVHTISEGILQGIPQVTIAASQINQPVTQTLKLVPYYAWNNRGDDQSMIVWLPRNAQLAQESLATNLTAINQYGRLTASHTWDNDTVKALIDGQIPRSSVDNDIPRWTSWPQRSTPQQITFEFNQPLEVSSVMVYWYDDEPVGGGVRVPAEWSIQRKINGSWQPYDKYITDFYGTSKDTFNMVRPQKVITCEGLKIIIKPQSNMAVGILELQIETQ